MVWYLVDMSFMVYMVLIDGTGLGGQREGRHLRFCWCGDVEGRNLMCGLDWFWGVLFQFIRSYNYWIIIWAKFRKVWWNDCFDKLLFLVLRVSTGFKKLKCVRGCSRAFEPWIGIDWMGSVYLVFIVQIVLPEVWSFELYSLRMVARKRSSRQANKKWDGWGGDARRLSETEIYTIMNHFMPLSCDVFGHLLPIPTSTSNIATSKIYI